MEVLGLVPPSRAPPPPEQQQQSRPPQQSRPNQPSMRPPGGPNGPKGVATLPKRPGAADPFIRRKPGKR
ncbi:DEAD-box type RNA helicase [Collariella sp. IMI 366227]|nr:DEAD-box type RNA helicase [Collariella sp. IMI 366227]